MMIDLKKLNEEGEEFVYGPENKEMRAFLRELIGDQPFEARFYISPAGRSFEVRGTVKAQLPLNCAFCAERFEYPVQERVRELVFDAGDKFFDDENLLVDNDFRQIQDLKYPVGEFVYETIGLAEPTQPSCRENCQGICPQCGINRNEKSCCCNGQQEVRKTSAFAALKDMKFD
jgi:uncharacterized protein